MRKVTILILLISILGLVSVYAETWTDFIRRVEQMDANVGKVSYQRSLDDWSYDELGGVLATYRWLYLGYSDILGNAQNLRLTEQTISHYKQRRNYFDQMYSRLLSVINGFNHSARLSIDARYKYWFNYLEGDGKLIRF